MKYEYSSGAVIYTKKDGKLSFVIIESNEGIYGYPKGHLEEGETEKEAALREIYEEVGLKVKLIDGFKKVNEHLIPKKPGVMKSVSYYLATYDDEQELVYQEEELDGACLMTYEEAMDCFQYDDCKEVLEDAVKFMKEKNLF